MALTAEIKTDLYRFFAIAFDAAPGVTYMNVLAEAVESGMTVEQIVEVFTTKTEFTSVYPNFLTPKQFATKLVENVVGSAATAEVKAEAVADIEAAIASGYTRGKVIYQAFSNLAQLEGDAKWGDTAKLLANQVAYAQYYTEELLKGAEDKPSMSALRAAISSVTASTSIEEADIAAVLNPVVPPAAVLRTLTTGVDGGTAFTGGAGDDTFDANGLTLTTGDQLNGGAGTDSLNILATAATNGTAQLAGIENVNVRLVESTELVATLWAGVAKVSIGSDSVAGKSLTLTNADVATNISVAGDPSAVTASFINASGLADTASVSLSAVGGATAATGGDVDITLTGVESVSIAATGSNYVDLVAADAETITVTGDGANFIDVEAAAADLTVDASAATGTLDLDIGSGLSAGDVLKAGAAATDKLTAIVASTATLNPAISGFETIALTVTAPANVNLAGVTDVKAMTLANSSVDHRFSNVPGSLAAVTFTESGSADDNTLRMNYVSGADAGLTLTLAAAATATGGVDFGAVTLTNVKDLTVKASGGQESEIVGGISLDANAKSVTLSTSSATADLRVSGGAVAGAGLQSLTVTAASGDVNMGALTNGANKGTLQSVVLSASGEAALTVGAIDSYNGTDDEAALETVTITGGTRSVITVGAITAAGAATDSAPDVAVSVSLGEASAGSNVGDMTVAGVASVAITLAANAGTASDVGLITATAESVGDVTVSQGDNADLEFVGVTANEGDIGNISITTGASSTFSGNGGGAVDFVSSNGDVGNLKFASGNSGTIAVDVVANSGTVGDVSIASKANDDIEIDADDVGNVTATVTLGDRLTLDLYGQVSVGDIAVSGAGAAIIAVDTATAGTITIALTDTSALGSIVDLSFAATTGTVTVTTGAGADFVVGTDGDDTISTGAAGDIVVGGGGDDVLSGGTGANTLVGGDGVDTLTGGTSADVFYFDDTVGLTDETDSGNAVDTADTINGFVTTSDVIELNSALGTYTEADGSAEEDFDALVALADAALDGTGMDVYVSYNALDTGNAYVFIDSNQDGSFGEDDMLIILTGVDRAIELAPGDFGI